MCAANETKKQKKTPSSIWSGAFLLFIRAFSYFQMMAPFMGNSNLPLFFLDEDTELLAAIPFYCFSMTCEKKRRDVIPKMGVNGLQNDIKWRNFRRRARSIIIQFGAFHHRCIVSHGLQAKQDDPLCTLQ